MKNEQKYILGIDTSCDDTSFAVLDASTKKVLSNVISSQIKIHAPFGGVVPEIASRAHSENLNFVFEEALKTADITLKDIGAIAVTHTPGLIGCLLVGVGFAKALAYRLNVPLLAVNHLDAHLLSPFIGREPVFPYLGLVVSGGHTAFYYAESLQSIQSVGQTVDDAAGEAFDKCAKMLGLGYPGGPVIEKRAALGNPNAFKFTQAKVKLGAQYLSFSGLKTAAYQIINGCRDDPCLPASRGWSPENDVPFVNDLCASVQKAIVVSLTQKMKYFFDRFSVKTFGLSGGVAMNTCLRNECVRVCHEHNILPLIAEPRFCADNGAMIAHAALLKPSNDALLTVETVGSRKNVKRET